MGTEVGGTKPDCYHDKDASMGIRNVTTIETQKLHSRGFRE